MFVDPCIIAQFLQSKPNKMQQCIKILLFLILNEARHVSVDTPPIIRILKLHTQPLVLHAWKVVGCAVVGCYQVAYATWQHPTITRPTTFHVCKSIGCLCSFRLLMIGSVSPEACWASFKTRINKILIHCCILLGFLCKNSPTTFSNKEYQTCCSLFCQQLYIPSSRIMYR